MAVVEGHCCSILFLKTESWTSSLEKQEMTLTKALQKLSNNLRKAAKPRQRRYWPAAIFLFLDWPSNKSTNISSLLRWTSSPWLPQGLRTIIKPIPILNGDVASFWTTLFWNIAWWIMLNLPMEFSPRFYSMIWLRQKVQRGSCRTAERWSRSSISGHARKNEMFVQTIHVPYSQLFVIHQGSPCFFFHHFRQPSCRYDISTYPYLHL